MQCRTFGTGEKAELCQEDCSGFTLVKVKDRDKLPQPNDAAYPVMHCKERDANDCWFYYTYAVNNNTQEVHVVDKLGGLGIGLLVESVVLSVCGCDGVQGCGSRGVVEARATGPL